MLHTLPRPGPGLQTLPGTGQVLLPACPAGQAPDPGVFTDAVARYRALERLRESRSRLYDCLVLRADALFELADAVLCADHAVTSLVRLCLEREFTRGHGALYDALAAGRIDEERLFSLLASELPQAVDGPEALAWIAGHDVIDHGLLDKALAGLPRTMPGRCGTRVRGGAGCGSPSMRPPIPGRTRGAPRAGSTCTTAPATAGARPRPCPAGSTSSPPRPGTCAPRGPPSRTWRAPCPPPGQPRRSPG